MFAKPQTGRYAVEWRTSPAMILGKSAPRVILKRDVLLNVTREFKARVLTMHGENQKITWIDPPQPPLENEQVRFVPVHL